MNRLTETEKAVVLRCIRSEIECLSGAARALKAVGGDRSTSAQLAALRSAETKIREART